jgi:hypothetical protein
MATSNTHGKTTQTTKSDTTKSESQSATLRPGQHPEALVPREPEPGNDEQVTLQHTGMSLDEQQLNETNAPEPPRRGDPFAAQRDQDTKSDKK